MLQMERVSQPSSFVGPFGQSGDPSRNLFALKKPSSVAVDEAAFVVLVA